MAPPNKRLIKKKVNPRITTKNKQAGIDGPSKTVKKQDNSDFSTSKNTVKKDMFAIKAKPKKSTSSMKNTFSDDTSAKKSISSMKNTFSDDSSAKRNTKKDSSDFAVNKAPKKAVKTTKTSSPSTFGAAFKAARKKQGAGGTFTYKGKKFSTNRADDAKKTKKVVKKKKSSDFLKSVKSAATQSKFKKSGSFKRGMTT